MIALFARSNHPTGYGYGPWQSNGVGRAHGYVVVGVRCRSQKQAEAVIHHIQSEGLDLPDQGRRIYPDGRPERPYERAVGADGVVRWYSGGPFDWDYLFTIQGNKIAPPQAWSAMAGSRGDNRFCLIYDAKEVLGENSGA